MATSILHRPNPNQPQPLIPQTSTLIPPPQPPIFDQHNSPRDPYGPPQRSGPPPPQMPPQQPFDNRMHDMRHDPRLRDAPPFDRYGSGQIPGPMPGLVPPSAANIDPRTRPIDPRLSQQMPQQGVRGSSGPIGPNRGGGGGQYSGPIQLPPNFGNVGQPGANLTANQEQEKAQLIMQVLALSDRQIEMLPNEQRQSIMLLKEQITRGSN